MELSMFDLRFARFLRLVEDEEIVDLHLSKRKIAFALLSRA